MSKRKRFYAVEYARRIARAEAKGLSRSQARGHARANEERLRPASALSDERVQAALRALRKERSISRAARSAKMSTERLRKYALERDLIEKSGRRWQTKASLPRQMPIFSRGEFRSVVVGNAEAASTVGRYMSAIGRFLETNKIALIAPFRGHAVRDVSGKNHPFETNPSTLYRLGAGGEASFEQIYRIVI